MSWSLFATDPFTGTPFDPLSASLWTYAVTGFRISANGTSAGNAAVGSRVFLASAPANDQAVELVLRGSSSATLEKEEGILLRFTDDGDDTFWGGIGYLAYVESGNQLIVVRLDGGGSHTTIGSGAYVPFDGDVLRAEIIGDQLSFYANLGALLLGPITDATYASGSVGMFAGTSFDDASNMSIDSFTAYESAAAGQPTTKRWGGVPHMGTQKLRGGHRGGPWAKTHDGIYIPRRLAA